MFYGQEMDHIGPITDEEGLVGPNRCPVIF